MRSALAANSLLMHCGADVNWCAARAVTSKFVMTGGFAIIPDHTGRPRHWYAKKHHQIFRGDGDCDILIAIRAIPDTIGWLLITTKAALTGASQRGLFNQQPKLHPRPFPHLALGSNFAAVGLD